jgi:hypothetical protein
MLVGQLGYGHYYVLLAAISIKIIILTDIRVLGLSEDL